jgi:enterochelin esterase-like enzyme
MILSRRAALLGGAGLLVSACGVDTIEHAAGRSSSTTVNGFFRSRWMRTPIGWTIAYPHGHGPGDRLPVVVSLHGRGGTHRTSFSSLRLDASLDQVVEAGTPPFAIASVDGGDHGYWHRRTDGTDASAMVRTELLPLLAERGLDTDRLGLFGWSMGGFGALLMAGKQRLPVRAVAVSSPALFTSAGATAAGAFDSAADFEENDVYGHPAWLRGLELRMDCGLQDPVYAATHDLAARVTPRPAAGFTAGGHDKSYWRRVAPGQLTWLGRRLVER